MPPPRITCLFHDSTTITAFLNADTGRVFAGDLLIECALRPALGFVLNLETPVNYPGLTGLLGGADIGTLAHPTERLPAPIILAPGTPVSPIALRAAVPLLLAPDERLTEVTLLVPMSEARAIGATVAVADRFVIAWDATAFPHEELVEFGRWLSAEHLLTAANFAGLFPYAPVALNAAHGHRLSALLAPLAARAPGIQAAIIATAD
jgi:hypothetical protein